MDLSLLVNDTADDVSSADYPSSWQHDDVELPLAYQFEPGADVDGVAVDIPVAALEQVSADEFSWPVPGLREELVTALIRSLPKALRVNFVPAPNHAREFLASASPGEEPLLDALARYMRRTKGVLVVAEDWDLDKVPPYLQMTFRVRDDTGSVLGEGKDLDALKVQLGGTAGQAVSVAAAAIERTGLTEWDFGALDKHFVRARAGHEVRGYPALVDEGDTVAIRVLSTEARQDAAMRLGTRRLLMLSTASPAARIANGLDNRDKLALGLNPHGSIPALLDDCYAAAVDQIVARSGGPAWDQTGFERLQAAVRAQGEQQTGEVLESVRRALVDGYAVDKRLSGRAELALLPALADLKAQWAGLLYPGFVADAGADAVAHYGRYFAAMTERLDKLAADPRRDAVLMATLAPVRDAYAHQLAALPPGAPVSQSLAAVRWMIEEFRVSLWAQQLRTSGPVSAQRIERALAES